MINKREVLKNLYENYIKGTVVKKPVTIKTVFLCHLSNIVIRELKKFTNLESRVYINTKVLKHMYDSKPAEEFDFLLNNLHKIVKHPDFIYKNKKTKRGSYCLVKNLKENYYFCSIEIDANNSPIVKIATAFRIRKLNYLNDYTLLWNWKDDAPSS